MAHRAKGAACGIATLRIKEEKLNFFLEMLLFLHR
jgi:hypothetical protein